MEANLTNKLKVQNALIKGLGDKGIETYPLSTRSMEIIAPSKGIVTALQNYCAKSEVECITLNVSTLTEQPDSLKDTIYENKEGDPLQMAVVILDKASSKEDFLRHDSAHGMTGTKDIILLYILNND